MGIFDSLISGAKRPVPLGTLSALASMPWSTPGFGSGMGADQTNGGIADTADDSAGIGRNNPPSLVRSIRIGSPTGGLAPGNGWGDAPRTVSTVATKPFVQMPNVTDGLTPPSTPIIGGPVAPPTSNDEPHQSFFGQGGTGRAIAGIIGDALLGMSGRPAVYAPMMAQQQQEASRARLQASQQAAELDRQQKLADYNRAHEHQVINMGNGGVAQWGGDGSFTVLRQPDAPDPKQTPLQLNLATLRQLNPNMTDAQAAAIVQRGMQGYQYDPTYMAQRQDNTIAAIGARGTQARATKGTPTGNATRPNGSGGGGAAGGMSTRDLLSTLGR